jgi:hypothetical protein
MGTTGFSTDNLFVYAANESVDSLLTFYLYLSFNSPVSIKETTKRDMANGDPELKLNPMWV